jgi:hypothetical protein
MYTTIKRVDDSIIVSGEYPDLKTAIEDCVRKGVLLINANLAGANLEGANLYRANFFGANLIRASLAGADLEETYFSGADLSRANLSGANLPGAYLYGADLEEANLSRANLRGANLRKTNLRDACLKGANLAGANLAGADFFHADLHGADFSFADFTYAKLFVANLSRANLHGATLPDFQLCPEGQAFIAYKKLKDGLIATLEIPADVPRTSSLVGRKCRAQSARVVSIEAPNGTLVPEGVSLHDENFLYRTGEVVSEPKYDPDIRVECTQGVHFFMTKEEARKYQW